jgi:hypothetical protein
MNWDRKNGVIVLVEIALKQLSQACHSRTWLTAQEPTAIIGFLHLLMTHKMVAAVMVITVMMAQMITHRPQNPQKRAQDIAGKVEIEEIAAANRTLNHHFLQEALIQDLEESEIDKAQGQSINVADTRTTISLHQVRMGHMFRRRQKLQVFRYLDLSGSRAPQKLHYSTLSKSGMSSSSAIKH